jgi:hypothetical protein
MSFQGVANLIIGATFVVYVARMFAPCKISGHWKETKDKNDFDDVTCLKCNKRSYF